MVRTGFRAVIVALAVVVMANVSLAQRPGQGGIGGFGGGGQGNLGTVNLAAVQKELDITDDQKAKLKKLADDQQTATRDQFSGFRDLSQEERTKKMEELRTKNQTRTEELNKEVEGILTATQRVRLKQVAIQIQGTRALDSKEVAEALGLSDDQKAQLTKLRTEGRTPGQPGGGGQRPSAEEAQKQRDEREAKVLAVLTDAQKAKFETMKGKKFEYDRATLFGGRGGAGGAGAAPGTRRPGGNNPAPEKKDL